MEHTYEVSLLQKHADLRSQGQARNTDNQRHIATHPVNEEHLLKIRHLSDFLLREIIP